MPSPKRLPILRAGLMAVALAACSAATAQQAPADREDAALAYAQCIRDNGYTEFPDPEPDGFRFLIDPQNVARFKKAAAACQDIAPEGMRDEGVTPEALEELIRLAQCVRDNGLPDFPDPDSEGRFDPRSIGVGPQDPRLEAAMDTCREAGFGQSRIVIGG